MKLLELDLLAFGPFTNVRLDFSRDGALHLIYGPNEAGKSTALRAIINLLYGIPVNTPDAHRHAMPDLRIGARLGVGNGRVLQVVRRKGAKNTLLDAHDKPIGDDALNSLLGGVGESLFRSVFGLNHETLRQGAEALLQGKGGVGESLFAAAIGGRGIHAVLEQFESEASELYKPRGQAPRLNEAIRAFKEADTRSKNAAKSADAYWQQQDALARAREESAKLAEQRRQLGVEQSRLQRAKRVLPRLAQRHDVQERRSRYASTPQLPGDATSRRIDAIRERSDCAREGERLRRDVEALERQLGALCVAESLLGVDERVIADLQDRLGGHRKAARDLPQRRTELRLLEEEVLAIPARLGRPVVLDQIESLRVADSLQARIRTLAQQRSGLDAAVEHAQLELAARSSLLERQRAQLSSLPSWADVQPLQHAVARGQRLADVDDEIETATSEIEQLEHEISRRLARLAPWHGDVAALRALALPTVETVEEYAARFDAARVAAETLGTRRSECERRVTQLERDLDELLLAGDVPTEEQLVARRAQRDALWQALRHGRERERAGSVEPADEFERAVREADQLADRLRREANRVATQAKLKAELAERIKERDTLEREGKALDRQHERLDAEWKSRWVPAGIDPLRPIEMRGWLTRVADTIHLAAQCEAKRATLAALGVRRQRHRREINRAFGLLGESAASDGAPFATVLADAERALAARRDANAQRRERESTIADEDANLPALDRRHQHATARRAAWEGDWSETVAALGLPGRATTEEALAVLDQLKDLFTRIDSMQQLQRRVDAMEADAAQLCADIASLAARHAPELAALPVEQCAAQLIRSYAQAHADQRERQRIEAELREKRADIARYEEREGRATAILGELMQAAAVQSVEELETVERDAAEIAALERELRETEAHLLEDGEGATIEGLMEETRSLHIDAVRARLTEIETELEEIDERSARLHQHIGGLAAGLNQWETGESAADAAAEAQEYLAVIKDDVRKYLRLRLAAIVLRREIERYRAQNEAPLLARASELFVRLTLGSFSALRTGFAASDEPVLRCVRPDESELGVEGLSDGARDQLYLALRVASLERHAAHNQPMPVVLDDVLINFDAEREPAALGVLAELAARTQVLFFTHDARVVELARQTLPEAVRVEHVLAGRR